MTGDEQSRAEQKIQKIDERVSELYQKFNIDSESLDIARLDGEECVEKAYQLSVQAFIIQQELNRLKSKRNFIESNIKRNIYPLLENYSGYGNDVKFFSAIRENSYGRNMHNIQTLLQVDIDALEFLNRRLEALVNVLTEASKHRRREKWNST